MPPIAERSGAECRRKGAWAGVRQIMRGGPKAAAGIVQQDSRAFRIHQKEIIGTVGIEVRYGSPYRTSSRIEQP